jgi:hypothetical protein
MPEQPSKEVLRAIAIAAQAVGFTPGLTEAERQAIADHMIGVGDAIENFDASVYFAPQGHR